MSDLSEQAWAAFVAPYRAEAERLGFRFLDRHRLRSERDVFTDVACNGAGDFLELTGEGDAQGEGHPGMRFWVNVTTYVEGKHLLCLYTHGGPPRGAPRSLLGRMLEPLRAALDRAFTPAELKRHTLAGPSDLASMLERHQQLVRSRPGSPLVPDGDPLAARRAWEQRIEAEYDDDGVPLEPPETPHR